MYFQLFSSCLSLTGGNVHIHYQEEKCYDEEIFFYHLGCHQWVSAGERWSLSEYLWSAFIILTNSPHVSSAASAPTVLTKLKLFSQMGMLWGGVTHMLLLWWRDECCWLLGVTVVLPVETWWLTKFHCSSVVIKVTGWVKASLNKRPRSYITGKTGKLKGIFFVF